MNKKPFPLSCATLFTCAATFQVFAAPPHSFTAGAPARAAEVNENFNQLDQRVTVLEQSAGGWEPRSLPRTALDSPYTTFVYHDVARGDDSCDRMERTRVVNGNQLILTEIITNSWDGERSMWPGCTSTIRLFEETPEGVKTVQRTYLNVGSTAYVLTHGAGIMVWPTVIREGASHGSFIDFRVGGNPVASGPELYVSSYQFLSGTYAYDGMQHSDCAVFQLSTTDGVTSQMTVACPGVGTVFIRDTNRGGYGNFEWNQKWVLQSAY
jgi:hypothetical protein